MPALTDLASVKRWLGLTAAADDALLQGTLAAVSAAVESMLNRTFAQVAYTETRNGTGRSEMMVREDPIISVASVTVDGVAIAARSSVAGSGYTYDEDTIYLVGACFNRGVQNVVLSYSGGYQAIPVDITEATTEAVAFLYREKERIGLSSKVLSGETTAFLRDFPPHLMRRFQQYQRVVRVA
jgi:gp6-like head-tail connector protein